MIAPRGVRRMPLKSRTGISEYRHADRILEHANSGHMIVDNCIRCPQVKESDWQGGIRETRYVSFEAYVSTTGGNHAQ